MTNPTVSWKAEARERRISYLGILGYALLFGTGFFLLFGVVTVLIPNRFFLRMTTTTPLDYLFLTLTSGLLGTYLSLHLFQRRQGRGACTVAAYGGGVGGFLGFGCALCNKPLLLLLGVSGVLTYIEPYRPLIGSLGIGLMGYAVYRKGKGIVHPERSYR
ncbi:MAG: hypothetical protein D6736_06700 [Nitrospinota bacterium]|nr:MAG: hypothetical protein D6736_06700 [Nitrospinota bacterium]